MAPLLQEQWFILLGIANAVKDKEVKRTLPPGADVSVAYAEPARASVLTVPYRISSAPCLCSHPYVAAADSSGELAFFHGPAREAPAPARPPEASVPARPPEPGTRPAAPELGARAAAPRSEASSSTPRAVQVLKVLDAVHVLKDVKQAVD